MLGIPSVYPLLSLRSIMQANTGEIGPLEHIHDTVPGIINDTQDLSNDCNPAVRHLQHFISELEEFLKEHVKEIQNLKGFLERGAGYPPAMCTSVAPDHAPRRENGIQGHVHCIQHFLEQHTHNIESLRVTLRSPMPELRLPVGSEETKECEPNDPQIAAVQMFEREDHSSSYSTIVLMSTFTAGLIVAFLQLMYDMLPPIDPKSTEKTHYTLHYHMGFGFGFVGLVLNLCVAIVAGANTIVRVKNRKDTSTHGSHSNIASTPDMSSFGMRPYDVNIVVDDGSATAKGLNLPHTALDHSKHFQQRAQTQTRPGTTNRPLSTKEGYARRSVVFAFAQFFGAATFGVCITLLYYLLHSGHILVFVPMFLLTGALILAGWHLIRSTERKRKRSD